jgi:peptide/nickel transport system permease protein
VTALILRRLAISLPLLLAVSFVTFLLLSLTPGNAAYTVLGSQATPGQLAQLQSQMGLNKPLLVQYGTWLGHALQGNFGHSLISGQSVGQALAQQVAPTLSLVLLALIVSSFAGMAIGIWSAVHGGRFAQLLDSVSFVGMAVPGFVIALVLIQIFVVTLHLLPASGYVSIGHSLPLWFRSLILPVISLSIGAIGIIAKQTRTAMQEVLSQEYIVVLRANGYSQRSIILRHALRAASVQVLSIIGVVFVGLLSGAVLIESIFSIPGLGSLAVQASAQSDIPVVLGVTVLFTLIVVITNLLLDIVFMAANPKIAHA